MLAEVARGDCRLAGGLGAETGAMERAQGNYIVFLHAPLTRIHCRRPGPTCGRTAMPERAMLDPDTGPRSRQQAPPAPLAPGRPHDEVRRREGGSGSEERVRAVDSMATPLPTAVPWVARPGWVKANASRVPADQRRTPRRGWGCSGRPAMGSPPRRVSYVGLALPVRRGGAGAAG